MSTAVETGQAGSPSKGDPGAKMKISCDREQLLHAFQTVAAVAPVRSPKPILQNVKLDATDKLVELTATDLEIGIRHIVAGVDLQSPGSVVLPSARFGSILRESSDQTLHLESDGTATKVVGERSRFRLSAEDPREFPVVAEFDAPKACELPGRLLRELVRRTAFATDNESSRYALGGVKLELADGEITAVGTDGRRLAKMVGPVAGDLGADQTIIVPTRAMHLIERAVMPSDDAVRVAVRGNEFLVASETVTISARLLEGRFPDWRKVFPESGGLKLDLAVGATLTAVRQAAIVTSEESRGIDFTFENGLLVLSGLAAEVGQSRVELPIGYEGDGLTITLDPRFMVDFLKVLDPEKTFSLEVRDAESAAVLSTDDGYGYVIMPLARDR